MNSLPDAFVHELEAVMTPAQLPKLLESLHAPQATTFRIHRLNAEQSAALAQLAADGIAAEPLPWYPRMFLVEEQMRRTLTEHPLARDGSLYIQNPSSVMPILALAPQPGEEVMDMCAAPGGKTLCLVDAMEGEGRIAAIEAVRGRFFKLRHMMQLYRATMVDCYQADARSLWRKVPERFDRILLDAPCSSGARIRAGEPESWRFWSPKKSREMARKQRGLIRTAFDCLKPGGTLVYCTCTYAPEENELVVQSLLDRHGDSIRIEAMDLPCPEQMAGLGEWRGKRLHDDMRKAARILPDGVQDAFFLCRMRKL